MRPALLRWALYRLAQRRFIHGRGTRLDPCGHSRPGETKVALAGQHVDPARLVLACGAACCLPLERCWRDDSCSGVVVSAGVQVSPAVSAAPGLVVEDRFAIVPSRCWMLM